MYMVPVDKDEDVDVDVEMHDIVSIMIMCNDVCIIAEHDGRRLGLPNAPVVI